MRFDDTPVSPEQMGTRSRRDHGALHRRDNFDDPVPTARASSSVGPDRRTAVSGRHAARRGGTSSRSGDTLPSVAVGVAPASTGRMRRAVSNHTGVAAVTAAVTGVGVSAGMFGFALFAMPTAMSTGTPAALSAHAPSAVTAAGGSAATASQPHHHSTGYVGKRRKPVRAQPIQHPVTGLSTTAATPAGTASGGTAPAPGSSSAPAPSRSSSPSPTSGGGGTGTQSGGGHTGGSGSTGTGGSGSTGSGGSGSTGTGGSGSGGSGSTGTGGSGSSGSGGSGSEGGLGGLLGGLGGLLGGLTSSL